MVKLLAKKSDFEYEKNVIKIGYCHAQYLLKGLEPIAYTKGTYGWNADIYHFNQYYIVTGYRPFGKIDIEWDKLKVYELKAEKIWNDYKVNYSIRKLKTLKLLQDMLKNCCN